MGVLFIRSIRGRLKILNVLKYLIDKAYKDLMMPAKMGLWKGLPDLRNTLTTLERWIKQIAAAVQITEAVKGRHDHFPVYFYAKMPYISAS